MGDGWWVLVGVGWYFSFRLPYAVFFLLAQLLLKCIDGLPGDQLLKKISKGIVSSPRCACASRVHLFFVYAASRSKIIGRSHGFWMLCLSFFTCCATFASKPWVTPGMTSIIFCVAWDRGSVARCFLVCLLERAVCLLPGTPDTSLKRYLVATNQINVIS